MVGFFIAVLSGILMSVQGVFNTQVTKQSSLWTTSAFVQLTALLVCVLAWLFTDRSNPLKVLAAKPSYLLLGGVIGAFITYTVVVSMGKQIGSAADQCLSDRTSGDVRCRKGAVFCQKTGGNGSGGHRRYCF